MKQGTVGGSGCISVLILGVIIVSLIVLVV